MMDTGVENVAGGVGVCQQWQGGRVGSDGERKSEARLGGLGVGRRAGV